jgi:hypothetical protein
MEAGIHSVCVGAGTDETGILFMAVRGKRTCTQRRFRRRALPAPREKKIIYAHKQPQAGVFV